MKSYTRTLARGCFRKLVEAENGRVGVHRRERFSFRLPRTSPTRATEHYSIATNAAVERQYQLPHLDDVENVEKYRRGGFHPIHLGDRVKDGRYQILHKLGYGGFSTVWLGRDEHLQRLVSIKVLSAEASQGQKELELVRYLDERTQDNAQRNSIISISDHFSIQGPNGTHVCYVSRVGGPSISQISDCPGQTAGSRRLRAPLARKLAGQLANAVLCLHSRGIIHGDITPKNVLLCLANIDEWSTDDVIRQLDCPIKETITTMSGEKPGVSAPEYLVQPTTFSSVSPKYLSEEVLLIDLGEAFMESSPPPKGVGTPVSYRSPELILEGKASRWSDVWALACTIFEMRSGFPLFESFLGSTPEVLEEMVRILRAPPEQLLSSFSKHDVHLKPNEVAGGCLLVERMTEIGEHDEEPLMNWSETSLPSPADELLLEPSGTRISNGESNSLAGLLQRMLDYDPEYRFPIDKIVQHKWFPNYP